MEPEFWHQRWQEKRIGFHQPKATPLMLKHWPSLGVAPGSRVFVPLAGKSQDMLWFAAQGYRVLGVELSQLAVEQFFGENDLPYTITQSPYGRHYRSGEIELVCGDAFALDTRLLEECDAVFDRAALIALPPAMRERYATELYGKLPGRCRGLLITLEYPQHEMPGPPFSVPEDEVRRLYGKRWTVDLLERRDILEQDPGFAEQGVTALHTAVYRLGAPA
ncbi:thiopurine S-methyltransferase [Lysobacter olei]